MLYKIILPHLPEFIKKKKLDELFSLTADSFQVNMPINHKNFSFTEYLLQYALFTKNQAEAYLKSKNPLEEIKHRLYNNSFIFGRKLRKRLHIKTWEEAVTVFKALYKTIGIDFQYKGNDEFLIKQCFFSRYYSNEVCMLISSIDAGLAAGLSNGGKLIFSQRITEGCSCCKGFLYRSIS